MIDREAGTAGTEPHGRLRPQVHAGSQRTVADALVAGGVAALLGGLPSTLHAMSTGGDPLEASRAAGTHAADQERDAQSPATGRRRTGARHRVTGLVAGSGPHTSCPAHRGGRGAGRGSHRCAGPGPGRPPPSAHPPASAPPPGRRPRQLRRRRRRGPGRARAISRPRRRGGARPARPPGRCFTSWLGPDQPRLRSESQAVQAGHAGSIRRTAPPVAGI